MSESVRNSDLPNMLDSQELFANTKKMTGLITEELKSRGYEPRELSDEQLRKVIQKAPKTANRLEQITDNVLSQGQEGRSISDKDVKTAEELFDQFAKPVGSSGLEGILMSMVSPAGKIQGPKQLVDAYKNLPIQLQAVEDAVKRLASTMGASRGKVKSDNLDTRYLFEDFSAMAKKDVDEAYKILTNRRENLQNTQNLIKSYEKMMPSISGQKLDMAEEVGKRFMAKSKLSEGGLIEALKTIRNR